MISNNKIDNGAIILLIFSIILYSCGLCHAETIIIEEGESIQAVIDKATSGDIIEIKSGTYKGNLDVNKRLALYGMDSGNGKPTITSEADNESAITLSADGCTVHGLMIESGNCGLTILSNLNNVNNNTIVGFNTGISLEESKSNIIDSNDINIEGSLSRCVLILRSLNNTIKGNKISFYGGLASGIAIFRSFQNAISDNIVKGNGLIGGAGISSHNSFSNILHNNSIKTRGIWGSSIYLSESFNNALDNNNVEHNDFSGSGITLSSSHNNRVEHDIAEGKGQLNCNGIFLRHSNGNYITSNKVSSTGTCGSGLSLIYSDENLLDENDAVQSTNGLYIYSSSNNTIEDNIAKHNDDDIYIDFYSPHNSIKNNTANLYIVEPRWSHVENNHGKVREFVVEFPDELPIFTVSDLADLSFLIEQFVLSGFDPK